MDTIKRKTGFDNRLCKMYNRIEDKENQRIAARTKKMAIKKKKFTDANIYEALVYFAECCSAMDDEEKRQLRSLYFLKSIPIDSD